MKTNIEIPVADLKSVLPGLSRIVSKRTSLPVLGCVRVIHSPDHTVRLQANNLDQIVTVRLRNPSPGLPGELLVPLEELTSIAKKCSASDTIELSATDKETVLTYPAAGTRINKPVEHIGVGEFPSSTDVNTEPVALNDAFKQALREALDCVSEDQSRYAINGACLDVSKKEAHYVVGTDGRHMFSANSFLFDVPESIIIPPGKFLTWPGFMEDGAWTLRYQPAVEGKDKVKINSKPAQVRLDSDHWTFVSKPIESVYPNWKQVVPSADALKSHIALAEPGVKIILEALPLLPGNEDRDQPVSLEVKHDALFLKAKGGGVWTEIPIPAQVTGLPVSISLNRKYLAKALRFGLTQIDIGDKLSALVFRTKGKTMVVMPLRSDDPATMPVNRPTTGQPLSQEATAQSPVPAQENDSATPPMGRFLKKPSISNSQTQHSETIQKDSDLLQQNSAILSAALSSSGNSESPSALPIRLDAPCSAA